MLGAARILLLLFFASCCVAVPFFTVTPPPPPSNDVNCTVDSGGNVAFPDYTDLQSALDGCRGPGGNLTNVTLYVYGDYSVGSQSLTFPGDANFTLLASTNGTATTIFGSGFILPQFNRYPNLIFDGFTFNLGGGNESLFFPQIYNHNLTFTQCIFQAFNGTYLFEQEACVDKVHFTLQNNSFQGIDGAVWYLTGIEAFHIQDNRFPNGGNSIVNGSYGFIQLSQISHQNVEFNRNWHWRVFECRKLRCRYNMFNYSSTYEFRCNNGQTECFDARATAAVGCPIGNFVITDPITNHTTTITNGYDPICRQWGPCVCNVNIWRNGTTLRQSFLPNGNIKLTNGQILKCVPAPGEPLFPQSPFFSVVGVKTVYYGIKPTIGQAFSYVSSGNISIPNKWFKRGVIQPSSCFCPSGELADTRNPLEVPCEYIIEPSNASAAQLNASFADVSNMPPPNVNYLQSQNLSVTIFNASSLLPSFCSESKAFCCAPPNQYEMIFKQECSLFPDRCAPAIWPNNTVVNPFQTQFYDCEYLANCTQTTSGLSNCTRFRCNMRQCMDGVAYGVGTPCWDALNLGSNLTYVEMTIKGGSLKELYVDAGASVLDYYGLGGISPSGSMVYLNQTGGGVSSWNGVVSLYTLLGTQLWSGNFSNVTYTVANVTITVPSVIVSAGVVITPGVFTWPVNFTGGTINSVTFRGYYPQCNDLTVASNDTLCLFARDNCFQYYTGNYPSPGYVPYGASVDVLDPNSPTVLSPTCSFALDDCTKFQGNPLCVCQDCHFSPCRTGVLYSTNDTCFSKLNLGSNATDIYLPIANSSVTLLTVDAGYTVQSLLFTGGDYYNGATLGVADQTLQSLTSLTAATGTLPVLAYQGGMLWDAYITNAQLPNGTFVDLTISGGQLVSPLGGTNSVSYSVGFVVSATFQLPYAQCNDLSVNGSSSPLCDYMQQGCNYLDIDNTSGYIKKPSNYQLPTLCPLESPLPSRHVNQTLFFNVTYPCEFAPQQCASYLVHGEDASTAEATDDRCDCTTIDTLCDEVITPYLVVVNATYNYTAYNVTCNQVGTPSGLIPWKGVLESIIVSNVTGIPSQKLPRVVLPLKLDVTQLNCSTNLWYQCDCPPYYRPQDQVSVCPFGNHISDKNPAPNPDGTCNTTILVSVQECITSVNCSLPNPPDNYDIQLNGVPLTCDSASNSMKCNCEDYLIQTQYPAPGSITWQFANFPNTSRWQMIDNSACWHETAVQLNGIPTVTQRSRSSAKENFYDEYYPEHTMYDNDGEFLKGSLADTAENYPYTPYRRECENGCKQDYRAPTREQDYECIVDASASEDDPNFGVTLFTSLNHVNDLISFKGVCSHNKTVLIKYSSRFYREPEDWQNRADPNPDNLRVYFYGAQNGYTFASLDGAVLVGSRYQFDNDADGITFVGLHFVHPGGDGSHLFDFIGDARTGWISFYNCYFDGRGSAAGMVDTYLARYLDIRYSYFLNWNVITIRAMFIDEAILYDNTFINCAGRVLQLRYYGAVNIVGNTFLDCRPGSDLKGASLMWVRDCCSASCRVGDSPDQRRMDAFRDTVYPQIAAGALNSTNVWPINNTWYSYFDQDRYTTGVSRPKERYNFFTDYRRIVPTDQVLRPATGDGQVACQLRRNFHYTDRLGDDQQDTFMTIHGGWVTPFMFTDNGVAKAQYGIQILEVPEIIGDDADFAAFGLLNPLITNSVYRISPEDDPTIPPGYDFVGLSFRSAQTTGLGISPYANRIVNWNCNFPCNDFLTYAFVHQNISCYVNGDFGLEFMPSYEIGVPRYGFHQYRNISDGADFCRDFQVEPDPFDNNLLLFVPKLYITTYHGYRYFADTLLIQKSIWLIGNNTEGACISPYYKATGRGNGNTIEGFVFKMTNLQFELQQKQLAQSLWQSGQVIPAVVEIEDCVFDGNNVIMNGDIFAVQFFIGTILPPVIESQGSVAGQASDAVAFEKSSELPPLTFGFFRMDRCVIQNFTQYYPRLITPDRRRKDTVLLDNYPWTTGVDVTFVNRLNTETSVVIRNNTFLNIDRTSLSVRFPINATITFNYFANCSGRSKGNVACFYYEGNVLWSTVPDLSNEEPQYNASVIVESNYGFQNKTILANYTQHADNLVLLAGMWMRNIAYNTTFCLKNNSFFTYPVAARFGDFGQNIWTPCLTPPNDLFFPDARRFLRAIALELQCNRLGHAVNETGLPGLNGTSHDIEFAFRDAYLEVVGAVLYCDRCCDPVPPDVCFVEPPGVNFLFTPAHPWWDIYVFTSVQECVNHCNATSRVCQLIGQDDLFGAFLPYGQPVPPKVYNETLDFAVGPNINSNQTDVIIRGSPGVSFCAPGGPHRIDNPLHLTLSIEGVVFKHCINYTGPATWDYSDPTYDSTYTTWLGNEWDGLGRTERPIDGTFDYNVSFIGNYIHNYTGDYNARFTGRNCSNSTIYITENTFEGLAGVNLEVLAYDNMVVGDGKVKDSVLGQDRFSNIFIEAGGSTTLNPLNRYVLYVSTCLDTTPGTVKIAANQIFGPVNNTISCFSPLWTGIYISPVPWKVTSPWTQPLTPVDVKNFEIQDNYVDDFQCIGMRLDNTNFRCDTPDQQGYLRELIYYRGRNNLVNGQVFDLYVGPFNSMDEGGVLATPDDVGFRCKHCEDGCPRNSLDLASLIIGAILLALFLLLCFIWWACPQLCWLCPQSPNTWHFDAVLGRQVPDDRHGRWLSFLRLAPILRRGRPLGTTDGDGDAARASAQTSGHVPRPGGVQQRRGAPRFPRAADVAAAGPPTLGEERTPLMAGQKNV
jgi:hypothetical protein